MVTCDDNEKIMKRMLIWGLVINAFYMRFLMDSVAFVGKSVSAPAKRNKLGESHRCDQVILASS